MGETIGLYVHIPFCEKKCHYCDFLTFAQQEGKIDTYVEYLIKEMALYNNEDYHVDSLYFGGGTPSYLSSKLMRKIMAAIREYFTILDHCEVSIEMNPESVNAEKLQTYLDCGFNRFTMGVQSFHDPTLKMMGRLHNKQTVLDKVGLCRKMGIDNLGIDLMFANPKQDMEALKEDVRMALTLDVDHISYYSLMIKPNTPYARWVKTKQITLFDDDLERQMYHYIQECLVNAGYHQYEISNFSRGMSQSIHNKKYWRLENYLGIGLGASSNMDNLRFSNVRRFDQYFDKIDAGQRPILIDEKLTKEDREKEFIMLNLRLLRGFDIEEVNEKFGIDFLSKYQEAIQKHLHYKTVQLKDGRFMFTNYGLDVGNQFYLDIL